MNATRVSIVSTILGHELLDLTRASMPEIDAEPPAPVTLDHTGFAGRSESWTVRYSSVFHRLGGELSELCSTGGVLLSVSLQAPSWSRYRSDRREYRLPPSWTDKRFMLAVARLEMWAREQHQRILASESLARIQGCLTDDDLAEVERIERETGRSSAYDLMSVEDANFWVAFIRGRHPEAAIV